MAQSVNKQIGTLAAVETERHFVQVGLQVLGTDFVPRSNDAAFQKRECRFHGIRMDFATSVFLDRVIDLLVGSCDVGFPHSRAVDVEIIRHNHINIGADVFLNVLCQRSTLDILSVEEAESAATLPDANDNLFVGSTSALGYAFAASATADIGLIHFNGSVQHWALRFDHSATDAVTEIPSGFVADTQHPLDLIGRHTLARLANQMGGNKPLEQGQVRVMEDRASGNAELVVTLFAVQELGGQPC